MYQVINMKKAFINNDAFGIGLVSLCRQICARLLWIHHSCTISCQPSASEIATDYIDQDHRAKC